MIRNAIENFHATLAIATPEEKPEVMEFGQLALAGDVAGYWAAESQYLRRQFEREDKLAAEKLRAKTTSDSEYREQAALAESLHEQYETADHLASSAGQQFTGENANG